MTSTPAPDWVATYQWIVARAVVAVSEINHDLQQWAEIHEMPVAGSPARPLAPFGRYHQAVANQRMHYDHRLMWQDYFRAWDDWFSVRTT